MAKITPLFSSSKGNSFLLSEGEEHLLIDCGVTTKRLKESLLQHDLTPTDLRGIILTHEHIDHIKAVKVWSKHFPTVPIYASEGVLAYMEDRDEISPTCESHSLKHFGNNVGEFWVEHFITPHDSIGSVGFRITLPSGKLFGFATDIGCITDCIKEGLLGCDAVVLESNYDKNMLKYGDYPYHLKQRIASDMGHLDNVDTVKLGEWLHKGGTERFLLAHLSQENNIPSLAQETFVKGFSTSGIGEGNYRLQIASPVGDGKGIVF